MLPSIAHDDIIRNTLNPQFLLKIMLRLFVFYFRLCAQGGGVATGTSRNLFVSIDLFKRRLAELFCLTPFLV